MPRPSKHVSPDTLGGRIRAAREELHLSLADVANGHYSTSLISQIERNRVDPSHDSLQFLAERLHLSLKDLEALVHQNRETEIEAHEFKSTEELHAEVSRLLKQKEPQKALGLLEKVQLLQVPWLQRWRIVALRGHCHFAQKHFFQAMQDFVYAVKEQPKQESLSAEQQQEFMLLHLHLASCYRELELDEALAQYELTLQLMNKDTPSGYVAEAHWGLAIVAFLQAYKMQKTPPVVQEARKKCLLTALQHVESARSLYLAINDTLRVATVTCQIAQIEKELGHKEQVKKYMQELFNAWEDKLKASQGPIVDSDTQYRRDAANIVSASASTLAGLALEAGQHEDAQRYVDCAIEAAGYSYPQRRADAYIMRGRLLEKLNTMDPEAEKAFRQATEELDTTDGMAMRIIAHNRLGNHLFKRGDTKSAEQELEQARSLAELVAESSAKSLNNQLS